MGAAFAEVSQAYNLSIAEVLPESDSRVESKQIRSRRPGTSFALTIKGDLPKF